MKTPMFLWKTLEDTEEDVRTSRIFAWKTQILYSELNKINYSFTGLASSRETLERCPRLPQCLPASSTETHVFWVHSHKVALQKLGSKLLAKRKVRGVYRKKGIGLSPAHVEPGKKLRISTAAKSTLVGAGVGRGRVMV